MKNNQRIFEEAEYDDENVELLWEGVHTIASLQAILKINVHTEEVIKLFSGGDAVYRQQSGLFGMKRNQRITEEAKDEDENVKLL